MLIMCPSTTTESPADTLVGEKGQGFKIVRRKRRLVADVWRLTTARFSTE